MAFRTKKISQMDPKGSNLASTDLLEISQLVSGSYVTKSITGAQIAASAPAAAWGTITGTLSAQTDLNTALSGKVPTTRTLTINGTTQDLSADRTFTISTGITIGTTAITSGTVGRVLFEGTGNVVQESANLFWDNTNGRLGVGTASPTQALNVSGFSVLTTSKTTATPILAVTNTTSSNPNSNNLDCFAPNMPNASVLGVFYGGKNINSRNNFGFNWNHVSDGSTGNSVSFEMVNVANIIRAWATGNVGLNTGTDAGYKLDVNGTARVQNKLSVGTPTQATAVMEITSTTQGFLPPRMTTTQKNAIASPTAGLVVYDSTLNKLCVRTASAWETITSL